MYGESVVLLVIYLVFAVLFISLAFRAATRRGKIIHGVGAGIFLLYAVIIIVVSLALPEKEMCVVAPPIEEEYLPPGADARLLEIGCGMTFDVTCVNVAASSMSPADVVEMLAPEWYGEYCRLNWQYSTEPIRFSAENVGPDELLQFLRTF